MVFNATFNNISVNTQCISWRTVSLVDETGVPGENNRPAASHWKTLLHNVLSSTPRLSGNQTQNVSGDRHWKQNKRTRSRTIRTPTNWKCDRVLRRNLLLFHTEWKPSYTVKVPWRSLIHLKDQMTKNYMETLQLCLEVSI